MFNLKAHNTGIDGLDLLRIELKACGILRNGNGFSLEIGDEIVQRPSLSACLDTVNQAILELKYHISDRWQELSSIADKISSDYGRNTGSLDNLIFLNSVKHSFSLSRQFSDLIHVSESILGVLESDIASVDSNLVKHFNVEYLRIKCSHKLIMNELYRIKLLNRYMKLTKSAGISGPWSNLELPIEERVWEWDEDYFQEREKDKRSQIRYNPEEAASTGAYYVWVDQTRDPYAFTDLQKDSPYKSRSTMTIP